MTPYDPEAKKEKKGRTGVLLYHGPRTMRTMDLKALKP
jgi:hypothetical protein